MEARIRIDKWLWHARLVKTRGLAADLVSGGKVRVNGARIEKPGRAVGPGDVLTVSVAGRVRLLRILDCGLRRGPADEAAELFLDLEAAVPPEGDMGEQAS
ncbi:RNA-binding S4 domain-containing protein [Paenirhodobacter populi]|uniref:RNA-binding S4 domain-containing protein n=1 Tax=Paenirhodobacter populi TaxID=2306993 RepID=A0A451GCG6_9RHOB|nr:RNA-binding S4 domain-containing protein [Sinirhodobacter populi]RWR12996.1 RNA-binding S4 domain-containing protein [Sinirhodobacter populi]